jgi:4-amino-4-deoxy-L-arabinose transferase-like glycosyltransferase
MQTSKNLFLLLAAGFIIRTVGLASVPPALNSDELLKAFDGASVYRTGMDHHGQRWPLFFQQSGEYSPPLYIYFAGLFSAPFGVNAYTVRLPSAILGTLSILMTFLFVKAVADQKTALIAAALATISPWDVHYSRIGWEAILLVPLQLAALWTFVRWSKSERLRDLLLSASFFGLTIYAYPVARLSSALLIAGLSVIYWRILWKRRSHALLAAGLFVLWLAPYLFVLSQNYEAMQARWQFVSLFNRNDALPIFIKQYFMHLSPDFLFIKGNPNSLHSLLGGMALAALAPFFFMGIYRMSQQRNREDWLLLFWFFTFAIPSSLTFDRYDPYSMPSSLRAINGLPILEIISALGIAGMLAKAKNQTSHKFLSAGIAIIIGLNATIVAYDAACNYPVRSAKTWQYGLREAIQFVESKKADYDRIIVSHKVRLHPVELACFAGREPGPFSGRDFPQYIFPFYHYIPIYQDFGMKEYQQYGLISRWYTLGKGKNLLLAEAGEIEAEPIKRIALPDGKTAYEIFETNR